MGIVGHDLKRQLESFARKCGKGIEVIDSLRIVFECSSDIFGLKRLTNTAFKVCYYASDYNDSLFLS